jgi:hypothetical protein
MTIIPQPLARTFARGPLARFSMPNASIYLHDAYDFSRAKRYTNLMVTGQAMTCKHHCLHDFSPTIMRRIMKITLLSSRRMYGIY